MEQEDYIKRQIDQLGRVLGKILADLTGFRARGQMGEGIEAADQAIKAELGLSINDLISIPTENFINKLQESRKVSDDNFDKLADLFFQLAEELDQSGTDNEKMQNLYERSLMMYDHLDQTSLTYSFDRHTKIEKIKNKR